MAPPNTNNQHIDRRQGVMMREIILSCLVAIIVGVGSSLATAYISVDRLQIKFKYLEKSVESLSVIATTLNQNEVRLAKIESLSQNQNWRIDRIEESLKKNN